jgi:DNA polymerase-3 subunit gamma/tau
MGHGENNPGEKTSGSQEEVPSINSLMGENKPKDDFNQAQLWEAWKKYCARVKEQDRKSYYATLTKHDPILKEDFRIVLKIDNHVQQKNLNDDKPELLQFLRKALNNGYIQIEGIIDQDDDPSGDKLFEPRNIYEAMAETNPALAEMKDLFDLDVEMDG